MGYELERHQVDCLIAKANILLSEYKDTCRSELTGNQYAVLNYLFFFPEVSVAQLIVQLDISKQQLSKIFDALEEKNLLERKYGTEKDKRRIKVSLTSYGISYEEKRYEKITNFFNVKLQALSPEKQESVYKAIQSLLEE